MELKRIVIIFLFCCIQNIYAESFSLSYLQHNTQNVYLSEEIVNVNENNITAKIQIKNILNKKINESFYLICEQNGYGCNYTKSLIPDNFYISNNNKNIDFKVEYNNKTYSKEEAANICNYNTSKIFFNIKLQPNEIQQIEIKYTNENYGEKFIDNSGNNTLIKYNFNPETSKKEIIYTSKEIIYKFRYFIFYSENKRIIPTNCIRYIDNSFINFKIIVPKNINNVGLQLYIFIPYDDKSIFRLINFNEKLYSIYNEKLLYNELITIYDLFFLSKEQLAILRNSIYAVHGYNFKNPKWKEYFTENFYGYKINPDFSESDFTDIEKKNLELIKYMENTTDTLLLSDFRNLEEDDED